MHENKISTHSTETSINVNTTQEDIISQKRLSPIYADKAPQESVCPLVNTAQADKASQEEVSPLVNTTQSDKAPQERVLPLTNSTQEDKESQESVCLFTNTTYVDKASQERVSSLTNTKKSSVAWHITQALPEHILPIANIMRETDKKEVWASHRQTPEEALVFAFHRSPLAWTCFVEEIPAFMFGVCSSEDRPHRGIPWLLSTPRIYAVQQDFLRHSLNYINAMHALFPHLENIVHAENTTSIRWLTWCGFTVETSTFTLINNEKFYHFWSIVS